MIRNVTLAYRYPASDVRQNDSPGRGLRPRWANEALVKTAFHQQTRICERALKFLRGGCTGILIMDGNRCVSRAWSSPPCYRGPHHLPPSVKRLAIHWIFWCATEEQYRGRGLYKYCLREILRAARASEPMCEVFIDTAADNIASRRAIESIGFEPRGVITTYRIPKTEFVVGRWSKYQQHPSDQAMAIAPTSDRARAA